MNEYAEGGVVPRQPVWAVLDPDEVFYRTDGTTFTGADLIRSAPPRPPRCADDDHIPVTLQTYDRIVRAVCATCGTNLPDPDDSETGVL